MRYFWTSLLVALFVASPNAALAASFTVSDGGFVDPTIGCSTASCIFSQTFELGTAAPVPVTGSFEVDTGSSTLDFEITVGTLVLVDDPSAPTEAVIFENTTYSATGLAVSNSGGPYVIGSGQTAKISGTLIQVYGGSASSGPFEVLAARVTGQCSVSGDNANCGLTFGTSGFVLDVGELAEVNAISSPQFFRHTANITGSSPVPEPGPVLLFAVGAVLVGGALRRSGVL